MGGPRYVKDFEFPTSFGFTGSATDAGTVHVRGHDRGKPHFQTGGKVDIAKLKRIQEINPKLLTPEEKRILAGDQGGGEKSEEKLSFFDLMRGKGRREKEKELGLKKGGKWIQKAIKHPGALHRELGVPQGKKIPAKKLAKAANSNNPTLAKRARLAQTLKGMHKAVGGPVKAAKGGGPLSQAADRVEDKRMISTAIRKHVAAPKPRGHGVPSAKMRGGRC